MPEEHQRRLHAAIDRRDLGAAIAAARATPGGLNLLDALDLVVLLGELHDPRFPSWARRWIDRATAENDLQPPAVASVTRLMAQVPDQDTPRAVTLALRTYARPQRTWG